MHGAALTHGVFMAPGTITLELKTLYAYDSILFPLVSDSHLGIHSQVNIKKYFVPGGQRPIDDSLVTRVMRVLDRARAMQYKLGLYEYAERVRRSEMVASWSANTTVSRRLRNAQSSKVSLEQRITCSTTDLVDFVDGSTFRSVASDVAKGNPGPASVTATGVPIKGDLVFGLPCSDLNLEARDDKDNDGLRHVLGPMQQDHSRQCQHSIYQAWRVALESKEEGIHCRMCDPYVL
eukprot:gene29721-38312_t